MVAENRVAEAIVFRNNVYRNIRDMIWFYTCLGGCAGHPIQVFPCCFWVQRTALFRPSLSLPTVSWVGLPQTTHEFG